MVSQKEAEVNLKMSLESTQIAYDTRKDGRSLQGLQVLGMLFLPASLCSVRHELLKYCPHTNQSTPQSVLGMGFFTTQPDNSGHPQFLVSQRWWIFVVVAVTLTLFTLLIMTGMSTWRRWSIVRKNVVTGRPQYDEEKVSSVG